MILKLILRDLELDLSNYPFTLIEENNWVSDKVQSKYTYPVEFDLTPEQNVALKNITDFNLVSYESLLEAEFYVMGEVHEAIFEIEKHIGMRITGQIRYGLEEFPNYDKPLSELPLENFELGSSIFDYAETIINQTWPAVNFNFPQVITDKIDTDTEQWEFFEGIINNYVSGDFLINEYDSGSDTQINRNIIQPLPYLLHILEKGFEDAGFILAGEILNDPEFKSATIYALSEFYTSFNTESATFQKHSDEYDSLVPNTQSGLYSMTIPLTEPGRYKIAGNIIVRAKRGLNSSNITSKAKLKFNNITIWEGSVASFFGNYKEKFFTVNVNVNFSGSEGDILFTSEQLSYSITNGVIDDEALIADLTLTQLSVYDGSGNLLPTLVVPNQINLSKCVPDMSFGEFVTAFTKWKNYGTTIIGNTVYINKKVPKKQPNQSVFNLEPFEVQYPERIFNQGKTFTLGFFDVNSDEYDFKSIFINNSGYQLSPYTKNDDTEEYVINALPLPLKQKGTIVTAHGFLDDKTKAQVVLYNGLVGGLNISKDPGELSILNVYLNHHQDWFAFLIKNLGTVWSFVTNYESIYKLKINSIVYAYKQFHIITKLSRKNATDNIIETEIELSTLD